jgi:hypothetical protein
MAKSFTGEEFAKALSDGSLKEPLVKIGMVKQVEDGSDAILFAEGAVCSDWIRIPIAIIEEVDHLTTIKCRDHEHPLVQIRFKEPPAENEAARAFAELARRTRSSTPLSTEVPGGTSPLARQFPTFPGGGPQWGFDKGPTLPGCECEIWNTIPTCRVAYILVPGTNIRIPTLVCYHECQVYRC